MTAKSIGLLFFRTKSNSIGLALPDKKLIDQIVLKNSFQMLFCQFIFKIIQAKKTLLLLTDEFCNCCEFKFANCNYKLAVSPRYSWGSIVPLKYRLIKLKKTLNIF